MILRVLIVEDEVLARLGLHQLIDWEKEGFELLADAKNGEEAIAKINSELPDIILLDLNIPECNGVEVQKYIKENGLTCETIVISCNEEFNTVKEVMRLGAFDFLRKLNLTSENLLSALHNCRLKIEQGKRHINSGISGLTEDIIQYDLLFKQNALKLDHHYALVCCAVLSEPYQAFTPWVFNYLHNNGIRFRLFAKSDSMLYIASDSIPDQSVFTRMIQSFEAIANIHIHLCTCNKTVCDLSSLISSLSVVECAVVYAHYDLPQKIFNIDTPQEFLSVCPFDFKEDLLKIRSSIEQFNIDSIYNSLSNFFNHIRESDLIMIQVLRRMYLDVLGSFSQVAGMLDGAVEDIYVNDENLHYQFLIGATCINTVEKWFKEFSAEFVEKFLLSHKCAGSDVLKKTVDYVMDNLDQQIQLASVSKYVGISEAYLSTIFKREMGIGFIAFVNREKINRAKKLLEENMLVCQVSDTLGFENNAYFSKLFKKYTGISPDLYRKNHD